ncbi:LutC/YkgG family protein [Streptomyces sp. Qhu_M48]|uniref:LutC/YkgG family protein n=1 Tax=Streptomyces sp. Qhu_M48 TaxID=3435889 RepID=UPI003F4F6899
MNSRQRMLSRIRDAIGTPSPEGIDHTVTRAYAQEHGTRTARETADLLAETVREYRAGVHRSSAAHLPGLVAHLLEQRGAARVIVPRGLPGDVLAAVKAEVHRERAELSAADLDAFDSVITGCALAIAETGTIVLDAGPDQGSRRISLVPDHHICVVHPQQIVGSVPQAIERLSPTRPMTWISGPSASSDIELDRVEGVHGPRSLDVVIVS